MTFSGTITRTPIEIDTGIIPCYQRFGLLASFARRWQLDPAACLLVPFDRFVTGRIPDIEEYPFPYMSLNIPGGSGHGRSDRSTWCRRTAVINIWVDMAALEDGEDISEALRRVYCSQNWSYDYGDVIDVLDGGLSTVKEVNEATFSYKELVKTMTLCIQQPRLDTCGDVCNQNDSCYSSSSSSSGS